MRYNDSFEKSAEYLRLALPLMSRQDAALHPLSYAVWYEFISGANPTLKEAVDKIIRDGRKLDEQATADLHRKYIAEIDVDSAQRISSGFQRILQEMASSAEQTGSRAGLYGIALEKWVNSIGKSLGTTEPLVGLEAVLSDTRQMQSAVLGLARDLDDSRLEIEALRLEVSRARADALADALTGLVNRKGFDLAIDECISNQNVGKNGLSLVVVDIDFFKRVNDSYGHLFGDKVLKSVAQILKQNIKGKDTAARYGGEEFVILLPETPIQGAQALANSIRASVERCRVKRCDNQENIATVTVSLGVASYQHGESANDLLGRADQALYVSKREGRNRVTLAAA